MGLRSRADQAHVMISQAQGTGYTLHLTSISCVLPSFDSLEHFQTVIDEIWLRVELWCNGTDIGYFELPVVICIVIFSPPMQT
jgi:hypothetical protein